MFCWHIHVNWQHCLFDGSQITVNIPTCLPLNMLFFKHVVYFRYILQLLYLSAGKYTSYCSPWNTTDKRQTSCLFISTLPDTRRVCVIKIPHWCFVQIFVYHFLKLQFVSKCERHIKKLKNYHIDPYYFEVFQLVAKYTRDRVRWVCSHNVTVFVQN